MDSSIAIVIPAYNEEKTIRDITVRCLKHVNDVIVVDDGSADSTAKVLADLPATCLVNSTNMGKAHTLWRGIQHAITRGASAVITLDGDGQHNPDDIPDLIHAGRKYRNHIIIAARTRNRHLAPPARRFANTFADFWVSWASGYPIRDSQSGFRLYPAALFDKLTIEISRKKSFVFESEILINAAGIGIKSRDIPINTVYSANARHSHYRPVADTSRIVMMIAGKLLSRGMYPSGLFNVLKNRR